jgi:hypothetical protein
MNGKFTTDWQKRSFGTIPIVSSTLAMCIAAEEIFAAIVAVLLKSVFQDPPRTKRVTGN